MRAKDSGQKLTFVYCFHHAFGDRLRDRKGGANEVTCDGAHGGEFRGQDAIVNGGLEDRVGQGQELRQFSPLVCG